MSSWSSSAASGATVTPSAPEVQAGQTLFSSSSGYSILESIGEGCFGKVVKCQNLATKETVAVKILKDTDYIKDMEKEVSMLGVISVLNPDRSNVVKFFECFEHMGQTCLAFEMLDGCLYDLLQERDWKPLSLNEIRPIAKQLLVALDALKALSILHADIKPDNIMCVNKQDQPLRVKLIDFGEAIQASKVRTGMDLQPTGYRAPEVALGLPITEAIDVWGVGCVLAFLYLSENLFPVDCDYQMMKCMVEVLGQPEDHLLRAGEHNQYFFSEEEAADGPTWRLMTPEEYTVANNMETEERNSFMDLPSSLDDMVNIYPEMEPAEFADRRAFVDLMKQLLHLDGDQRISPYQALQRPFITMSHLTATRYIHGNGVSDDGPTTGSSDEVAVTCSYDKDPAAWSSDRELPSPCHDKDPAADAQAKDLHQTDAPACWSSDGGFLYLTYNEDLGFWSFNGGPPQSPYNEDIGIWSFNGGPPQSPYNEDPAARSSDGGIPKDLTAAASASSGRTKKLLRRIRKFFTSLCCCCHTSVED